MRAACVATRDLATAMSPTESRRRTKPFRIDKLTPIIGAEVGGIDLSQPLGNRPDRRTASRACRELRDFLPRPAHHARTSICAFGRLFGDLHIHPAAPARARQAGADDHPRRQGFAACQRRGLAHRRELRCRAADGQHPLHQEVPAQGRRHAVRQPCTPPTRRCPTA